MWIAVKKKAPSWELDAFKCAITNYQNYYSIWHEKRQEKSSKINGLVLPFTLDRIIIFRITKEKKVGAVLERNLGRWMCKRDK